MVVQAVIVYGFPKILKAVGPFQIAFYKEFAGFIGVQPQCEAQLIDSFPLAWHLGCQLSFLRNEPVAQIIHPCFLLFLIPDDLFLL